MDTRREFLTTLGVGLLGTRLVNAQTPTPQRQGSAFLGETGRTAPPPPPVHKVKTTPLFKSPEGYPNGIAATADGLWIGEQKSDNAVLVDWNGKLLKTVKTQSKNTSGIAFGDGSIWMAANAAPEGIFQTDLSGKTISHRQIPLGPADNGGGCHGCEYVDGKLWIAALRLRGILRVDAKTWQPEFLIPYAVPRAHGMAYNRKDNSIWMVTGSAEGNAGLIQFDAATGRVLSTAVFAKTDADPHGLAFHNDQLYSCDAGIHPGWPDDISPTHGSVFKIDLI
jgi:streptogramin lyase